MDFLEEVTVEVNRGANVSDQLQSLVSAVELKNIDADLMALEKFRGYTNPLLNAGTVLLATCIAISRMPMPSDIYRYRKALIDQITLLQQSVSQLDYSSAEVDKCCFLFCISLDEFILHSPWGKQSSWENNTLVSELFGVRDGGEQFFLVTEKAIRQPKILGDLLELIYVFIKIGFKGQYRLKGREELEQITHQIEQVIFEKTPPINLNAFKPVALPRTAKPHPPIRFFLQWAFFSTAIIIMLAFSYYWFQTQGDAQSESFTTLASFNTKHLLGPEQKMAVYISTDTEMSLEPEQDHFDISRVDSAAQHDSIPSKALEFLVQIGSFTSHSNAAQFLQRKNIQPLGAQMTLSQDKYRVVIPTQSKEHAKSLSAELKNMGFDDAFYYSHSLQTKQAL